MSDDKCVVCGAGKAAPLDGWCSNCAVLYVGSCIEDEVDAVQWGATRARKAQAEKITRLRARVEELKEMIHCADCGGPVEDPRIDEYGDGPFCEDCEEER